MIYVCSRGLQCGRLNIKYTQKSKLCSYYTFKDFMHVSRHGEVLCAVVSIRHKIHLSRLNLISSNCVHLKSGWMSGIMFPSFCHFWLSCHIEGFVSSAIKKIGYSVARNHTLIISHKTFSNNGSITGQKIHYPPAIHHAIRLVNDYPTAHSALDPN